MAKKLKTITLGRDCDNPDVSLCPGHVGAREFNKAFAAEGWSGGGRILKADMRHEWWKKLKRSWKKSEKGAKGAKPVTVSDW